MKVLDPIKENKIRQILNLADGTGELDPFRWKEIKNLINRYNNQYNENKELYVSSDGKRQYHEFK